MRRITGNLILAAAATGLLSGGLLVGCSTDNKVNTGEVASLGSIGLKLSVSPGVTLSTVSYTITGPNFSNGGTINVQNLDGYTLPFVIGGLPAGGPYTVSVTGTASNSQAVSGSSQFQVLAGQTTPVGVTLQFVTPQSNPGAANVTVTTAQAPIITYYEVAPTIGSPNSPIAVRLEATNPVTNGGSGLTYAWSATPASLGTFDAPGTAQTQFRCSTPGTAQINVVVSNSVATATITTPAGGVTVTCVASGSGGTGGGAGRSGTGGASGAGSGGTASGGAGSGGTASGGAGAGGTASGGAGSGGTASGGAGAGGTGTGGAGSGGTATGGAGSGAGGAGAGGTASGGAGTGAGGAGAGGAGSTLLTSLSQVQNADCTSCESSNGVGPNEGYALPESQLETLFPGTLPDGAPRAQLYWRVLQCVRTTHCAVPGNELYCYCGATTISQCNSGNGLGACRSLIEQGVASTDPSYIKLNFTNVQQPGGLALNQVVTDNTNGCPTGVGDVCY